MKTVLKRLLSFVLVAMMLVSVLPFQASADTYEYVPFYSAAQDFAAVGSDSSQQGQTADSGASVAQYFINKDSIPAEYQYRIVLTFNGQTVTMDKNGFAAYTAPFTTYTTGTIQFYKKVQTKFDVQVNVTCGNETKAATISGVASISYDDLVNEAKKLFPDVSGEVSYTVSGVTFNGAALSGTAQVTADSAAVVTLTATTEKVVKFYDKDGNWLQDVPTEYGQLVSGTYPLEGPKVEGRVFEGWYSGGSNGSGDLLNASAPANQYYAHYSTENNGGTDGVSAITVYCKVYADDKVVDEFQILPREVVVDNTVILDWLKSKKDQILVEMNDQGYGDAEWNDFRFYDNATGEPLTQADVVLNANKYVYVKLDLEDTARVLVCVHGKVGTAGTYYKLDGYLAYGNYTSTYIQKSDVIDFIKTKYSVSSSNVDGLYGEQEWKELCNDERETSTGVTSYKVKDDDTTIVHVILTNATLKGTGTASDNPKTGDTIMMAGSVLGISTAALAAVYFLNKKKQVM